MLMDDRAVDRLPLREADILEADLSMLSFFVWDGDLRGIKGASSSEAIDFEAPK
jgi:hypothetical protein